MLQHSDKNALSFTRTNALISKLLNYMHDIANLHAINDLLDWDQNTFMPEGAGEMRGIQMATLEGLLHERWINPQLRDILYKLEEIVGQEAFTDADRALVRETRHHYDYKFKLPQNLVMEMARTQASAFEAWRRAKEQNDFAIFAPLLEKTVTLQKDAADRVGYVSTRYDALLGKYEPTLTASKVEALFEPVREVSVSLLKSIIESNNIIDVSCLKGNFSVHEQMILCNRILHDIGYNLSYGSVSQSLHPSMTTLGSPFDVRITISPDEKLISTALMAALHEGGHALYEQGSASELAYTPVVGGASIGMHESQSHLWENAIGRSEAFWKGHFATVKETFPDQFAHVDATTFAYALNNVRPSCIRIEADEVTYNLHIIIRFELEKALINGEVAIESLPRLWNDKYYEYLGIRPVNDIEGVLQDIHWTSSFGYFPTYTLGNLYAAQIYHTLRKTFNNFDEQLAVGNTSFALTWLLKNVYVVGATYEPEELIKHLTNEELNPNYFTHYLIDKFRKIYNLP